MAAVQRRTFARVYPQLADLDLAGAAGALAVPSWFVHGRDDLVCPMAPVAALVASLAARPGGAPATLRVLPAGHDPAAECPGAFAALLDEVRDAVIDLAGAGPRPGAS